MVSSSANFNQGVNCFLCLQLNITGTGAFTDKFRICFGLSVCIETLCNRVTTCLVKFDSYLPLIIFSKQFTFNSYEKKTWRLSIRKY